MILAENFANPPIVEAVVDFRVTVEEDFDARAIGVIYKSLRDQYPHLEEMYEGNISYKFGNDVSAVPSQVLRGFQLTRADKLYLVRARSDGFSTSALRPYEGWEKFRDETLNLWEIYRQIVPIQNVHRIALRYINRIDVPIPDGAHSIKQEDYLHTYPFVSESWPNQDIEGFSMTLRVPQVDLGANLIFKQARILPGSERAISLLVDIDIFSERPESPWTPSDNIWEYLDDLRIRKNEIFLSSLTEKTKELFR